MTHRSENHHFNTYVCALRFVIFQLRGQWNRKIFHRRICYYYYNILTMENEISTEFCWLREKLNILFIYLLFMSLIPNNATTTKNLNDFITRSLHFFWHFEAMICQNDVATTSHKKQFHFIFTLTSKSISRKTGRYLNVRWIKLAQTIIFWIWIDGFLIALQ